MGLIGGDYKNDMFCASFRFTLLRTENLSIAYQVHIFNVQMDGSSAQTWSKFFGGLFLDPFGSEGTVHIRNQFL